MQCVDITAIGLVNVEELDHAEVFQGRDETRLAAYLAGNMNSRIKF